MRRVVVSFGSGRECVQEVSAEVLQALSQDEARAWLADAFSALGCVASNPMGKVLAVDMILGVAQKAGEARFSANPAWAARYAATVATLRKGDLVEVDVESFEVRQGDSGR